MSSPIVKTLDALRRALDGLGAGWYLFGAQAALIHGSARLSADIDITVLLCQIFKNLRIASSISASSSSCLRPTRLRCVMVASSE